MATSRTKQQPNRPTWAYDSGFRPRCTVVVEEICERGAKATGLPKNVVLNALITSLALADLKKIIDKTLKEDLAAREARKKW